MTTVRIYMAYPPKECGRAVKWLSSTFNVVKFESDPKTYQNKNHQLSIHKYKLNNLT